MASYLLAYPQCARGSFFQTVLDRLDFALQNRVFFYGKGNLVVRVDDSRVILAAEFGTDFRQGIIRHHSGKIHGDLSWHHDPFGALLAFQFLDGHMVIFPYRLLDGVDGSSFGFFGRHDALQGVRCQTGGAVGPLYR